MAAYVVILLGEWMMAVDEIEIEACMRPAALVLAWGLVRCPNYTFARKRIEFTGAAKQIARGGQP